MKRSAAERKLNSFSIDSIIADSRTTTTTTTAAAAAATTTPRFDTGPSPAQIPLRHSRSIPTDIRLSDPSLRGGGGAAANVYDGEEDRAARHRQRSMMLDYAPYAANYDHAAAAVAQFAAAAAAMATMTPCPAGAMDTPAARAAVSDRLSYAYWMHANRQHASPSIFLPGTPINCSPLVSYSSAPPEAKYCDEHICLSVCPSARISQKPQCRSLSFFAPGTGGL